MKSGDNIKFGQLPILDKFEDNENYEYFYFKDFQPNSSLLSQIFPFFIHQFVSYNIEKSEIKELWNALTNTNVNENQYEPILNTMQLFTDNSYQNDLKLTDFKEFINEIINAKNDYYLDVPKCEMYFTKFLEKDYLKSSFDFISQHIELIVGKSFIGFNADQQSINLLCQIFGSKITFYTETQYGVSCYKPDKIFMPNNHISFGILFTWENKIFFLSKGDNLLIKQYKIKFEEIFEWNLKRMHSIAKFISQLNILDKSIDAEDFLSHASGTVIIRQNDRIKQVQLIDEITNLFNNLPIKFAELRNRCAILRDKLIRDKKLVDNLKISNFKEKVSIMKEMFGGSYTKKDCYLCNKPVLMINEYTNSCGHTYCKQCI